jgi:hypothetical protein
MEFMESYIIEMMKSRRMRWEEGTISHMGSSYCLEQFDGKRERKSHLGESGVDVRTILKQMIRHGM